MIAAQRRSGLRSFLVGEAAEDRVAWHYIDAGATLLESRWRNAACEIDLIFEKAGVLIFVEVKQSRGRAGPAALLSRSQMLRLQAAVMLYLDHSNRSILTEVRLDIALIDALGELEIIENAACDLEL